MDIRNTLFMFVTLLKYSMAHGNFKIEQSFTDESYILSEIMTNYLLKYFYNDRIFISIVFSPSRNNRNLFQSNFLENLFNEPALTEFQRNILNKLDESTDNHRNAFNLISIDDYESLK